MNYARMATFGCALTLMAGCVEREWTIRSEPEGAVVWVSGVEKGRTPVTLDFTWYGDYEVIFRKDGYETLKTSVKLSAPWYEGPVIDFFSEIAPWTYNDRRETLHVLKKFVPPTEEELKLHAKQMREETVGPRPEPGETVEPQAEPSEAPELEPE